MPRRTRKMRGGKYRPPHADDAPCHPSLPRGSGFCLNSDDMKLMKAQWNENQPARKINSENPDEIRMNMREVLRDRCSTEYCWIKQPFLKNHSHTLKRKFRIEAPQSWKDAPTTWLDSNNILNKIRII